MNRNSVDIDKVVTEAQEKLGLGSWVWEEDYPSILMQVYNVQEALHWAIDPDDPAHDGVVLCNVQSIYRNEQGTHTNFCYGIWSDYPHRLATLEEANWWVNGGKDLPVNERLEYFNGK